MAELREAVADRSIMKIVDVLNEIRRIALADPGDIMNKDGSIKRIDQLDPDLRACIASYEVKLDGSAKYKFWDKLAALEKACRYLGVYEKDNRQRTNSVAELIASGNVKGVVLEASIGKGHIGDSDEQCSAVQYKDGWKKEGS